MCKTTWTKRLPQFDRATNRDGTMALYDSVGHLNYISYTCPGFENTLLVLYIILCTHTKFLL